MDISSFIDFLSIVVFANILLAVFNLVPIPPLDGHHVLFAFLPDRFYAFKVLLQRYGFVILIIFLLFFFGLLSPVMNWLFEISTGQPYQNVRVLLFQMDKLIFFLLVIIPSAILHEWSHGYAADRLGDPTPRMAGRLTINPIPHIDPWGTLLLPFLLLYLTSGSFLFAYAKPVPFNPLALRWRRYGAAAVGFAGPLANLILVLGLGILIRILV